MSYIVFDGKKVTYKNIVDLSKKLSIFPIQAKELIQNQKSKYDTKRLVVAPDRSVHSINMKNDFRGLLKQKFGISHVRNLNKKLMTDSISELHKTKYITAVKKIYGNMRPRILIKISMLLSWSATIEERFREIQYDDVVENIIPTILDTVKEYAENAGAELLTVDEGDEVIGTDGSIYRYNRLKIFVEDSDDTKYAIRFGLLDESRKKLEFKDGAIREKSKNLIFEDWLNINDKETQGDYSCVVNYLLNKYGKISKKAIRNLEKEGSVTVHDLLNFLQQYEISYKIYNGEGKKMYESPDYYNNKNYARLTCILHNNHIYPIEGRKLKKAPKNIDKIEIIEPGTGIKLVNKYINKTGKVPKGINVDNIIIEEEDKVSARICSFIINKTKYIDNPHYETCRKLLKKLKINDLIKDNIKLNHIISYLEKEYIPYNINSFFPNTVRIKTLPYHYRCEEEVDESRQISSVDKNACYASCLHSLPYLIVCDWRTAQKRKINKCHNPGDSLEDIIDHYMYIIDPEDRSLLIPDAGAYEGYHIKKCHMLKFNIVEEITTTVAPNGYKKIIEIMKDNLSYKDFKFAFVVLIGCMERVKTTNTDFKYSTIVNKDFKDRSDGYYTKINNDHYLKFSYEEKLEVPSTRMPINTQIKNMARWMLYTKIKELKLKDEDIIQINTDSITYYGDLPKKLDETREELYGWKSENVKIRNFNNSPKRDSKNVTFFPKDNGEYKRVLYCKYAGSGKSHFIMNYIIPLLKENNTDFIILAPTHKALKQYRKIGITNVDVIQKYTLQKKIPKEKNIIIDEIGMVDRDGHDLLYVLKELKCNYTVFGDFNQLLPFGISKPFDDKTYHKYLFNDIDTTFTNYRNNFTKEYYDSLLKSLDTDFLLNEVRKYSNKTPYDANVILCYRSTDDTDFNTKKHYNNMMLEYHGFSRYDVGTKHICMTNKLIKHNIYKCMIFTVEKKTSKMYTCRSEDNKIFLIKKRQFESKNYFDLAYAINVHQIQSDTVESYYWAPEDDIFMDGRLAYVVISRLRNKLSMNTVINNINNEEITKRNKLKQDLKKLDDDVFNDIAKKLQAID
jgi:hypothetical protein